MLTVRNVSHDPFYNQAFEEYVYQTYLDDDVFLLWQNAPAVVVGSYQNICREVHVEALRQRGIPVVRRIFIWLGQNSIWILCIHYCAIMLMELYLYNHKVLSNSIMDVVAVELFGFGKVTDKPKDVAVKVAVALVSIGLSAIYALIHKSVKKAIKSRKAA